MFDTDRLNAYLAEDFDGAPTVGAVEQIFGGASRDTYRVTLAFDGGDAREVIVRVPQPSGLIDTDQSLEIRAYEAFGDSDVPVPAVLAADETGDVLGRPFLMLELLPGEAGNPFAKDFYADVAEPVGTQFWEILGRIAGNAAATERVGAHLEAPDVAAAWQRELEHWLGIYAEKCQGPDPLFEAAVRWLRRNPPAPSGALGVVHGDYRMGNFLVDGETVTGILDWELVHLGDPAEDVGWALSYLWSRFTPERPGGMIGIDRALDIWRDASGRTLDTQAVHFWRVFNAVKGMAIWNSAGHSIASGANPYPGYLNGAWLAADLHRTELLGLLRPGEQGD